LAATGLRLREVEFKAPFGVRHSGKAVVRGVDECSSNRLVSQTVQDNAANTVFNLCALSRARICTPEGEQAGEGNVPERTSGMKTLDHTRLKAWLLFRVLPAQILWLKTGKMQGDRQPRQGCEFGVANSDKILSKEFSF
jgi:hypothetical protein